MSIGGLPALNDGNNARARALRPPDRAVQRPDVHLGRQRRPGPEHDRRPGVASKVMGVGSYITQGDLAEATTAPTRPVRRQPAPASRRAARARTAASSRRSSRPARRSRRRRPGRTGQPVAGTYTLPPGYSMLNGTSMASPQAAGAAALLVSAAKQAGVQKQPPSCAQAINSSARCSTRARYGAYEQGNGLINVGAAWDLLKTNIKTVDITLVGAGQHGAQPASWPRPDVGQGIYDREGVTAGPELHARCTPSPAPAAAAAPTTYNLTLGRQRRHLQLGRLDRAAAEHRRRTLDGHGQPDRDRRPLGDAEPGRPGTTGIDYQTMNIVDRGRTSSPPATTTRSRRAARSAATSRRSFFFNVPAGTPAFKVDFDGPSAHARHGPGRASCASIPMASAIDSNASTTATARRSPAAAACNPTQPHDQQPAGGRLGGDGRGAAHL